jgi:hypothetical protein
MTPQARKLWLETFDPSRYLENVRCPILFLNGTTDFAYPLDSYDKSYRLVPEPLRTVCIVKDLPHGHIWDFKEVDVFVESALNGGIGLPRLGPTRLAAGAAAATVTSPLPLKEAALYYTTDDGPWQKRVWQSLPASVDGTQVSAPLPEETPRALFLGVTDSRGLRASSELLQP